MQLCEIVIGYIDYGLKKYAHYFNWIEFIKIDS